MNQQVGHELAIFGLRKQDRFKKAITDTAVSELVQDLDWINYGAFLNEMNEDPSSVIPKIPGPLKFFSPPKFAGPRSTSSPAAPTPAVADERSQASIQAEPNVRLC